MGCLCWFSQYGCCMVLLYNYVFTAGVWSVAFQMVLGVNVGQHHMNGMHEAVGRCADVRAYIHFFFACTHICIILKHACSTKTLTKRSGRGEMLVPLSCKLFLYFKPRLPLYFLRYMVLLAFVYFPIGLLTMTKWKQKLNEKWRWNWS